MNRTEALALGLSRFTTGKPCKRGHNTYRYTQSGSCAACIAEHRAGGVPLAVMPTPHGERVSARPLAGVPAPVLADFKANAIPVRLRAYEEKAPALFVIVEAYNIARWPEIPPVAYEPTRRPQNRAAGTALYEVYCHAEDYPALLQESNVLLRQPGPPPRVDWVRINAEFDAEEQRGDGWPTGDPK